MVEKMQLDLEGAKVGSSQSGIGEALKIERLRQKRSLHDIAYETRISSRMLEAIERDDYDSLPGLLFARNFVKQYALALRLDPAPMLDAMPRPDISTAPLPIPPSHPVSVMGWDPAWNGAISSIAWLILAFTAATAAYIHFNRPLENQAAAAHANSEPSHPASATQPSMAPGGASGATDTSSGGGHDATPLERMQGSAVPAADHAPLKSPAAPANSAAPLTVGGLARKVNVSITAHEDSWIQVSSDGKTLFSGTLKANESKEFSADSAVKLIAGNAGGITVSLNGRTLDPLGANGQVRVLRLTEEGPQAAALANPPDPDRL